MPSLATPHSFSVTRDNPFLIVRSLQALAQEGVTHGDPRRTIDLSRGDPGFAFSPSSSGRRCAAALLLLDSDQPRTLPEAETFLSQHYTAGLANELQELLRRLVGEIQHCARGEQLSFAEEHVLGALFHRSAFAGGSYLDPRGEQITRVIVADLHRRETGLPVTSDDVVLVSGASHAIGLTFNLFTHQGFLRRGDSIAMLSPSYRPYQGFAEELGLTILPIAIDPLSGEVSAKDITHLRSASPSPKLLVIIDPHNPTGYGLRSEDLQRLADTARALDALIITDEVYFDFLPKKTSIASLAPERTIRISARSKIERSTGLRFGEIVTTPVCRSTLAKRLKLSDSADVTQALLRAKAPERD